MILFLQCCPPTEALHGPGRGMVRWPCWVSFGPVRQSVAKEDSAIWGPPPSWGLRRAECGKAGAKKPDRELLKPLAIEPNAPGHGQWRIYSLILSF